jgi:hypothetical protein
VRTDLNKSFILRVAGASTLANWQELLTPTDSVQSVDGQTGAVTIATATEGVKGKAQIATQAEVDTGTDDTKFVTAKKLMAWVKQSSEAVLGMMKVATETQTNALSSEDVVITPRKLGYRMQISLSAQGYIIFPSWMGGLTIQWGGIPPVAVGGSVIVTYPIAFVMAPFAVIPVAGSNGCVNSILLGGGGNSNANFQAFNNLTGTLVTGAGCYIAIGKAI